MTVIDNERKGRVRQAVRRFRRRRQHGIYHRPIDITDAQLDALQERGYLDPDRRGNPPTKAKRSRRLLFGWLGEPRFNRTLPEYKAIAAQVPKVFAINSMVASLAVLRPRSKGTAVARSRAIRFSIDSIGISHARPLQILAVQLVLLCQSGRRGANHFRLSGNKSSNTKNLSTSQSRECTSGVGVHAASESRTLEQRIERFYLFTTVRATSAFPLVHVLRVLLRSADAGCPSLGMPAVVSMTTYASFPLKPPPLPATLVDRRKR